MTVDVAAGVLCDAQGRVLVGQRSATSHLPSTWEFPGGKFEPDESPQQALQRELAEELGIQVLAAQPLITLVHQYPEKRIRLHVFDVLRWQGEPHSREQQPLRWVDYQQLSSLDMPPADVPILKALRLPGQYLITPACNPSELAAFLESLRASLWAGIGIVQLRQPGWPDHRFLELAAACRPICAAAGTRLVVNSGPDKALQDVCDGFHLNSRQLEVLCSDGKSARPVESACLLGASCHNLEQLQQARQLDCDYVLLSPVKPTTSHPEARPLGWRRFAELAKGCNLPVYALGGMQPADQDQARANGAVGVAGISSFWRS